MARGLPSAHVGCPILAGSSAAAGVHALQVYERDTEFVDIVTRFVGAGLAGGDAVMFIARADECRRIEEMLRARGIDVAARQRQGMYLSLDAEGFIDDLLLGTTLKEEVLEEAVRPMLTRLRGGDTPRVRVFGETVALLWARGHRDAALALESWWDGVTAELGLSVLCTYPVSAFLGDAAPTGLHDVCARHTTLMPSGAGLPDSVVARADSPLRVAAAEAWPGLLEGLSSDDQRRLVDVTRVIADTIRRRKAR